MKDWRGVEINVGDTVVYGAGVSRSISPTIGKVLALVPGKPADWQDGGKRYWASEDKVRLEVLEYAFGYRSDVTKAVSVMPERVTVVQGLAPSTTVCPECREAVTGYQRDEDGNCRRCAMRAEREA